MPKPELYMIFTGEKPKNPPNTISLSKDFFGGEKIAVDVEVKVLFQEDENSIIGQYIIFCKVYNEQRKKYGQTMGRYEEAVKEKQKAIELAPGNPEYHDSLGITLNYMGCYEEALEAAQKAVELEPENEEYKNFLEQITNKLNSPSPQS